MANQETQFIDDLIVKGRRKMMALGISSLAGLAFGGAKAADAQTATYGDTDILNFALNLEYLEANFYYMAAFGTNISTSNAASLAAGAPLCSITGIGTQGTVTGGAKVPFTTIAVSSYAIETAVEEGKHVQFLYNALYGTGGTSALQVAQPAIDISGGTGTGAFDKLASAAGIGASFNPYASDANFLIGAYVFEDVGVTAYHGAASLFTNTTAGKTYLGAAAGILAVEAYHAGLVRTTINSLDPTGSLGLVALTTAISNTRAALAKAAAPSTTIPYDPQPDDYGIATTQVSLAGGAAVTATRLVDVDLTSTDAYNSICFSRNTTQVLNIVTGGGAINGTAVVSPAKGVFFPAGMNGLFK